MGRTGDVVLHLKSSCGGAFRIRAPYAEETGGIQRHAGKVIVGITEGRVPIYRGGGGSRCRDGTNRGFSPVYQRLTIVERQPGEVQSAVAHASTGRSAEQEPTETARIRYDVTRRPIGRDAYIAGGGHQTKERIRIAANRRP